MSDKIKKFVTARTINIVAGAKTFKISRLIEETGKVPVETELSKKIMKIFEDAKTNPELLDIETSPILDMLDISRITVNTPFLIDPIQCIVYLDGEKVDSFFSDKIVQLYRENKPFTHLLNFYKRFEKNISDSAKKELFLFLAHNGLPITNEGYFIAYKAVRADYYSIYNYSENNPNNVLNLPKTWVTFDRSKVDPSRTNTCSYGLHAATHNYASKSYGGPKLVTVVIDPADVVAVPYDYENQKLRTCAYYVLEDCTKEYTENFIDLGVIPPKDDKCVITSTTEEAPDIKENIVFYREYKNSNGSIFKYKKKEGKGKNLCLHYIDEVTGALLKVFVKSKVPAKWIPNTTNVAYQYTVFVDGDNNVINRPVKKIDPKPLALDLNTPTKTAKKPVGKKTVPAIPSKLKQTVNKFLGTKSPKKTTKKK